MEFPDALLTRNLICHVVFQIYVFPRASQTPASASVRNSLKSKSIRLAYILHFVLTAINVNSSKAKQHFCLYLYDNRPTTVKQNGPMGCRTARFSLTGTVKQFLTLSHRYPSENYFLIENIYYPYNKICVDYFYV